MTVTFTVFETAPVVAVTRPDVDTATEFVDAVNVMKVAPLGTVTVAGRFTAGLALDRVTTVPDGPAALTRLTLKFKVPKPLTEAGETVILVTRAVLTVITTDLETVPCEAITDPTSSTSTALVVAVKLADNAPSSTTTEAGTVTAALLLTKPTVIPPAGAAPDRVTLPLVDRPPLILDTKDKVVRTGDKTVTVLVTVVRLAVAVVVTTTFVSTTSVDTGNVTVEAPSGTTTVAGIVRIPLSALSVTSVPPAGDLPLRVTVPVAVFPPVMEVGL